ncbi:hypothetical protein QZH41_004354 [Actinostola sp. cb2023]|nr:hypothetical protein QZH41_004354 [Actinostola sp. cb2023]
MSFREVQDYLVLACNANLVSIEEFCLLFDEHESKNHDCYHHEFQRFDLNSIRSANSWNDFRFSRVDIPYLAELLDLPNKFECYNRTSAGKEEALCIMLRKLASPCRFSDMVSSFGRAVPELSLIFNETLNYVYDRYGYLLHTLNQRWLAPHKLEEMAQAVFDKEAALSNCWGFVDGTNQKTYFGFHLMQKDVDKQAVNSTHATDSCKDSDAKKLSKNLR